MDVVVAVCDSHDGYSQFCPCMKAARLINFPKKVQV
jgi:hypothetical protein